MVLRVMGTLQGRGEETWERQCGQFFNKKWLGAENTRRAAPPKTHRLHMQKIGPVNSSQNPSQNDMKAAKETDNV